MLLLTCEALPAAADLERLAQALQQRGADLAAFNYVRRMRSLNLTGKAVAQPGVDGLGGGSSSQSQLLTWADKAFGQGLNAVTKGGWLQVCFRLGVHCWELDSVLKFILQAAGSVPAGASFCGCYSDRDSPPRCRCEEPDCWGAASCCDVCS